MNKIGKKTCNKIKDMKDSYLTTQEYYFFLCKFNTYVIR